MTDLTPSHLDELKHDLEKRLEILQRRLGKIQVHLRHENGPLSSDWEEQAVERENDEVLEALDDVGRLELSQIEKALNAMNEGTYGVCTACEEDIAIARLHALPFTPLCIGCAQKAETH